MYRSLHFKNISLGLGSALINQFAPVGARTCPLFSSAAENRPIRPLSLVDFCRISRFFRRIVLKNLVARNSIERRFKSVKIDRLVSFLDYQFWVKNVGKTFFQRFSNIDSTIVLRTVSNISIFHHRWVSTTNFSLTNIPKSVFSRFLKTSITSKVSTHHNIFGLMFLSGILPLSLRWFGSAETMKKFGITRHILHTQLRSLYFDVSYTTVRCIGDVKKSVKWD